MCIYMGRGYCDTIARTCRVEMTQWNQFYLCVGSGDQTEGVRTGKQVSLLAGPLATLRFDPLETQKGVLCLCKDSRTVTI